MPQDEVSYALGLSIGQNFKASGIKAITSEDFIAGLQDALAAVSYTHLTLPTICSV